jgi:hypothetical protein
LRRGVGGEVVLAKSAKGLRRNVGARFARPAVLDIPFLKKNGMSGQQNGDKRRQTKTLKRPNRGDSRLRGNDINLLLFCNFKRTKNR